ncbi:sigma 54 modulation/S30EA ribosomal C-terminal domain-containing protein [Nocardia vinacea]|uniref:sigma 54 modulation/S30EA ribosomal C-terminal domain-containing protein n=1 Tax=Nocardia vinacea TaxID=96468 RepID=UPI00341961D2
MLEAERIAGAVGRLLEHFDVTDAARIRITGPNCDAGPMLVQVNLRRARTPTRIQTITRGPGDALPVVVRLQHQLQTLQTNGRTRPWPDPTRPARASPGPGHITRRKSVPLRTVEPITAATIMDAMDYDVYLFTDTETGEDAIVYRAGPTGLELARQTQLHPPHPSNTAALQPGPFTINPRPAPALTETQAAECVCEHGLPSLFYTDPGTGRGHLLYRRYDTNLGLITPDSRAIAISQ